VQYGKAVATVRTGRTVTEKRGCGMSGGKAGRYRVDTCEDDYYVEEIVNDDSDKLELPGCAPVSAPVKAPTDTNKAPPTAKPVSIPVMVPVRPPRKAPVVRPTRHPYSQGDDDKNDDNDDISNEDIDLPGEDDDIGAVEDSEFITNEGLSIRAPYVDDDELPPSKEDVDRNGHGGRRRDNFGKSPPGNGDLQAA
jgi:hypothetical protein